MISFQVIVQIQNPSHALEPVKKPDINFAVGSSSSLHVGCYMDVSTIKLEHCVSAIF